MTAIVNRAILALIILRAIPPTIGQCGMRKIFRRDAIRNAHNTYAGEWPWHVAVYHRKGRTSSSYTCGGSLITKRFVLSAAHCVFSASNGHQISANLIFVRLGIHDLDADVTNRTQQHSIQEIHTISEFTSGSNRYDIALLEMKTEASFNDYVQPVCINQQPDRIGQIGTAVGWGATEHDELAAVLQKIEIPAIAHLTCLESNPDTFAKSLRHGIFCAGYTNGTTVCNGDSGGGLFFRQGEAWCVAGITSFIAQRENSNLCSTMDYAGFTNVSHYLPWIQNITQLQLTPETLKHVEGPLEEILHPTVQAPTDTKFLPEDCGQSIVDRVPDGNATRLFAYPWMAQLISNQSSTVSYLCDGTLISKRYVLTSAYCLAADTLKGLNTVVLGDHTLAQETDCSIYRDRRGVGTGQQCAGPLEHFDVESFVTHPRYEGYPKLTNEVGLVRLSKDVVMKDHIHPVCLPVSPQLQRAQLDSYTVVGWGDFSKYSYIQKQAIVPFVQRSECQQLWDKTDDYVKVKAEHVCVRDQFVAPCIAVLGSPLGSTENGERFVQFGVWSHGNANSNCFANSVPSIYTRLGSHMEWILANIRP